MVFISTIRSAETGPDANWYAVPNAQVADEDKAARWTDSKSSAKSVEVELPLRKWGPMP